MPTPPERTPQRPLDPPAATTPPAGGGPQGRDRSTLDLLVVGAGPAGLARAFWARRDDPALRVRVLEEAGAPGGWMQTEEVDGYRLERGPQTVRGTPETDAIVEALGLQEDLRTVGPGAGRRWLARRGRLRPLPEGPLSLLFGSFLPTPARLRLLAEPLVPAPSADRAADSESVADLIARRLGAGAVPLAQAMVSGIFAGDVERLEVGAALPLLAQLEREHGGLLRGVLARGRARRRGELPSVRHKGIIGFEDGLQRLTDALVAAVGEDRIECGDSVESVQLVDGTWSVRTAAGATWHARRLVLAIPAPDAARLLRPLDAVLADLLAAERRTSVASVWLGYPLDGDGAPGNRRLQGFGFLQHGAEPGPLLGCLYSSRLFPTHAPPGQGLLRAMLGGTRFADQVEALDDEGLVRAAGDRVRSLTGLRADWSFTAVRRARAAIPQFELGHTARVRTIREHLREQWHGRLDLVGNSYEAVALPGQLARPTTAYDRAPQGTA